MILAASIISQRRSRCRYCPAPCAGFQANAIPLDDPAYQCPAQRWPGSAAQEPALPSAGRMAINFGKATIAEAAAIATGTPEVPDEEANRRASICRSNICGQFRKSDRRCAACGCFSLAKTKWRSQQCPKGHW